jgi:hypothetical protein
VIGFGRSVPEGAIQIARAPARKLRPAVQVMARHAYDGKTLLVPGIPEEPNDDKAAHALEQFIKRVAQALSREDQPNG